MNGQNASLNLAKALIKDVSRIEQGRVNVTDKKGNRSLYDELITETQLRKKTEKLFNDGHYARAVEEAYKLLDNIVKKRSGISNGSVSGAPLMTTVFSAKKPILKLNAGISQSENDEQQGYMQILAGCMTGIRNPRAHDSDWEDTEQRAIVLLAFANHLIERVSLSKK